MTSAADHAKFLQRCRRDFLHFWRNLRIDTGDGIKLQGDIAHLDQWQVADLEAMSPGLQAVAGFKPPAGKRVYRRVYLERPRGHNKTGSSADVASYLLFASSRRKVGAVVADDKDQAKLVRDAIESRVRLNPWLAELIEVQQYKVTNPGTGSELSIQAAQESSSWGPTWDFAILDELSIWRSEGMWHSAASTMAKRPGSFFLAISNAGVGAGTSWQWHARESFRQNPDAYFSSLDGPQASWISQETLAEQRVFLPHVVYGRVWGNTWLSGTGDALTEEMIDASFARDVAPMDRTAPGQVAVLGGDLSATKHNTAAVVLTKDRSGRLRVAHVSVFRPPISQQGIEEAIIRLHKQFKFTKASLDAWQANYLTERLKRAGVPIDVRHQNGATLKEQAFALVNAFAARNIDCIRHPQLEYDLRHLMVKVESYGMRLLSTDGPQGHGDVASALSIATAVIKDIARPSGSWGGVINVGGKSEYDLNRPGSVGPMQHLFGGSDRRWGCGF